MRGEIDWIVMKALEKERRRRYATADGFAADVQRYLAGEQVQAVPPSALYRLRKFAHKNRAALTTAATIVLLLVVGVAVSTWLAARATRSEQEARLLLAKAQRDEQKALKSAAEARATLRFFKEVTHEARCDVQEGDLWRPKTVDEAAAIIDTEKVRALLADYPLAEAEIREWIAEGFDSDSPIGKAGLGLSTIKSDKAQEGPQTLTIYLPGERREAVQLRYYCDPEATRHHLERAIELRSAHLGPNDPKTLATMHLLGRTLRGDDNPKALQVLGDVVARSSAAFGPDHDQTLYYKDELARAYEIAEKPTDAVVLWKDNYMLTKKKLGQDNNATLDRSDSLATAYEKAGRIEEALRQLEESLRGRRQLAAGSNDLSVGAPLWSVGSALWRMARFHDRRQDYTRAEPLWREALTFLKDDKNVVHVQAALGRCLLYTGKPADAEPVLRECLATRVKKEPDTWTTFHTKSLLGGSLLGQKKYADAEPLLLAGYEGMKKGFADKVELIEGLKRLVQLYSATGKKGKADMWRNELEQTKDAPR
jgi:tetratricopeptide (TPR) repeat protein